MSKGFSVFLLIFLLHFGAMAQTTTTATAIEPYLQAVTSDAATIMWRTASPAYGWVEYGETPALGQKQDWVIDGLRNANTRAQRVRLTGLKPGKQYFYRAAWKAIDSFGPYKVVFDEPRYSEVHAFTVPSSDRKSVTAVFLNDIHYHYDTFAALADRVREVNPEAVFLNGDCFDNPAAEADVFKALQTYNAGLNAAERPVYYVRGNHEARGAYARQWKDHFDFPGGENFFALTLGPVRFVVLDCGEDKEDSHREYSGLNDFTAYRQKQAEFLEKEIQSSDFKNAKYHILVHHIPLYGEDYSPFCQKLWEPILKDAPIDMAINAHVHKWKLSRPGEIGNPYPQVVGGGAKLPQATVIVFKADDKQCSASILDATSGATLDSISISRE